MHFHGHSLCFLDFINVVDVLIGCRVQNQYEKHKEVSTAQGVKILGKDLEKTLAGLPLLVAHKDDEIPILRVTVLFPLVQVKLQD